MLTTTDYVLQKEILYFSEFALLANLHFLQICVPAFLHAWYGNKTIHFHLLKLQGSRFTKVLCVI